MARTLCASLLALLLLARTSLVAGEVPYLGGRVNDLADVLSGEARASIDSMLRAHEDSTSNQIVVLTVPSLEGEDIASYAIKVAETWKLGQKGKDNGVLLVVAVAERKVRIEVGRGLEGNLTDLVSGEIIRHDIVPRFRENDYDGGIRAGVASIMRAVEGAYEADASSGGDLDEWWARGLFFLIFLVVVGVFTTMALLMPGVGAWVFYVFLLPFWFAFPSASLGQVAGLVLFGLYAVGFPVLKLWYFKTGAGKNLLERAGKTLKVGPGGSFWSSGGGGSTGGGGFSGGGGSFSGGGASGGW